MTIPHWLQEHIDITHFSAFKTVAKARYFYDITEREEALRLPEVYHFALDHHLPFIILWWGTNCLFAFDEFPGVIVRNRDMWWEDVHVGTPGPSYVRVHSGELSNNLATKLYSLYGISTLVPWIGLPGTFGGATVGNAWCFGVEMADIFLDAEILDLETGTLFTVKKWDMQFQYRSSAYKGKSQYFLLSTRINLAPLAWEYESYTPENLRSIRKLKQPTGFSCGSFFTNPPGASAGRLIDEAGLKWTRIGGVKISEQHGNFFINDQKGSYQDILNLRDIIKQKVYEKYGIRLHEEVRIITP